MKSFIYATAIMAGVTLLACGCADRSASTASTADTNAAGRTYSRQDLNKTGQHQTGPALEAADASITSSDGR